MPIDPRILQAIMAQTRSQASPSPMGPQGTAAPPTPTLGPGAVNAIGTTGVPVNPMMPVSGKAEDWTGLSSEEVQKRIAAGLPVSPQGTPYLPLQPTPPPSGTKLNQIPADIIRAIMARQET